MSVETGRSAGAPSEPAASSLPPIDLRPLFAPRSVAVVGASARGGIAATVANNLKVMGSATRCLFVNPRYDELYGEPCYPSLDALPETPDTVMVAVNPLRATAVVEDAARAGVPSLIIPGGGVVEGGEAAAQMQREVAEVARRHGIALLGPNCMGMVDLTTNAATYIGDINPWQPRGGVAGIAQSGSVTDAFIHAGNRIGFSRIIGCGSEVVLDACDFLAYCLDDPETRAVILFLEGFKRPERFLALADRALELDKPVLVVKVGRSTQAQAAAVAHSGSLAGEDRATDAALRAAGVIRCDDLDELLEAAELVAGTRRLGRRVGRGRTGVVTVSTGEASLIADLVPRTGVDLPPVPEAARDELLERLPTLGYIGNPLDPWGATDPPAAYRAAFDAFAGSGAYDVLCLVHDFPYRSLPSEVETAREVTAELIRATADRADLLPVYVSLTSGEPTPETKQQLDDAGGIPMVRGTVEAFRAIASLAAWERARERRLAAGPRRVGWPALAADRTPWGHEPAGAAATGAATRTPRSLGERESLALLATAGVPVTAVRPASDSEAAVTAARELGGPVALKLDAVGLAHKSDVGGVRLGLIGDDEIRNAAGELLAIGERLARDGADVRGLLVEPMAEPGLELIVGLTRDAQVGPVALVGLGGILAEALDDVSVALAPVDAAEALAMLDRLRGARLLDGVRGRAAVDRGAIARILVAVSELGVDRPDILEIDLNPVVASPHGAIAVDALVVVA
ncbi:MAG TPA: acetate--CoA ligase family protein [Candidatus Limnocylindrales bacterium]|nr:acetate--CoA ligase family protein [Candidatus Limnocylindrales bacterium]